MKKYAYYYQSFLKSIELQLFISFISLPFLIGWGLPISFLTPISTLIFGPFLTCFLLISSLIFFLELFYLPNTLFIWLLENITQIWLMCLNLEQRTWLIGFSKPHIIILTLIPCIALAIIHSKKIITVTLRIIMLALLLVATCFTFKFFPYFSHNNGITKIPCNNGEMTLISNNDICVLIDPGLIASRPSYESFISYTLLPHIIQNTGYMHVDHLIINKLNKRVLDAIQFLATKINIKHLYIPAWKGKIPLFAWRAYSKMKKTILNNHGKIVSISYKKQLSIDESYTLSITPTTTKNIHYYDATYQPFSVQHMRNNQLFNL